MTARRCMIPGCTGEAIEVRNVTIATPVICGTHNNEFVDYIGPVVQNAEKAEGLPYTKTMLAVIRLWAFVRKHADRSVCTVPYCGRARQNGRGWTYPNPEELCKGHAKRFERAQDMHDVRRTENLKNEALAVYEYARFLFYEMRVKPFPSNPAEIRFGPGLTIGTMLEKLGWLNSDLMHLMVAAGDPDALPGDVWQKFFDVEGKLSGVRFEIERFTQEMDALKKPPEDTDDGNETP